MKNTVELYEEDQQIVNDAFKQISLKLHTRKMQMNYKTFLVSGCSVNAGTTLCSIELAKSLARERCKTLFIDFNFAGNKPYWLKKQADASLLDYLKGTAEKEAIINGTNTPNLFYINAVNMLDHVVEIMNSPKWTELLMQLKDVFDYILFDVPSINACTQVSLLATQIDAAILVVGIEETKKKQLEDAVSLLEEIKVPIAGTIGNKAERSEYKQYSEKFLTFSKQKGER